jgi:hypothetical protein
MPKAAKFSAKPSMNAQIATSTSTSAVGRGQTRATTPAARSISEQQMAEDRPRAATAARPYGLQAQTD